MAATVLVGSTGFVGSHILQSLLASPAVSVVNAYTRRTLPNPTSSSKLHAIESTEPSSWPSQFPSSSAPVNTDPGSSPAPPKLFISALGTTLAAARTVAAQRAIDLDLNVSLASSALSNNVQIYVLISTHGALSSSRIPYTRMKGELEDAVKAMGFKHCVILRPGLIMGNRPGASRPMEGMARWVAGGLRRVSTGLTDWWGQEAEEIARAAVRAGEMCLAGEKEEGIWVIESAEVIRLGRESVEEEKK